MITSVFSALSVLAIVAGGLISAFTARRPTRFTSWVSAYLVLVVGIIQLGFVSIWHRLGQPKLSTMLLALLIYDLGNLSVITGTKLKANSKHYSRLVNLGGSLIALAMITLLFTVKDSKMSWALAAFVLLAAVILVSMPVGLKLSHRSDKRKTEAG